MTNRVIQLLVLAAAHQRQGRMQRASQLFVEASTSEDFPKTVRAFQAQVARAAVLAAPKPKVTAGANWPFNTVKASRVKAEAEGGDDAADDDVVEAGLEEDFVDMGLADDSTLDDAVLELSAAEDEEDEPEEVDAAADDGDADEDDGADDAPEAEKSAVTAALFARQCRNMLAVQAAAKKPAKKPVKKPAKKPTSKK